MKFLDRLGLAVFSIIVFALAVILCLMLFGWFDIELVTSGLNYLKSNQVATNISIGVSIFLILLAFKCMFFESYTKTEDQSREGILLENDNGKLLVSRDTLENLASSVAKSTPGIEHAVSKVLLDKERHLVIFVNLLVKENAIIKELSYGLQESIKQTIKESLGLDVKEVNIKIKNIQNEEMLAKKEISAKKEMSAKREPKEEKIVPKEEIKEVKKIKEANEPKEIKLN